MTITHPAGHSCTNPTLRRGLGRSQPEALLPQTSSGRPARLPEASRLYPRAKPYPGRLRGWRVGRPQRARGSPSFSGVTASSYPEGSRMDGGLGCSERVPLQPTQPGDPSFGWEPWKLGLTCANLGPKPSRRHCSFSKNEAGLQIS